MSWIKMRHELQTHPKIFRILSALKADKSPQSVRNLSATKTETFSVVGGLHAVWSVFDQHSEDGVLRGYTPEVLDQTIGWDGFSEAMMSVGWLAFDDAQTLTLPEFGEHNGKSAKRRAEDQKRKTGQRLSEKNPQTVRDLSADDADKKRSRERERSKPSKPMSGKPDPAFLRQQSLAVLAYLNEKSGRHYEAVDANTKLIVARMGEGASVEQLKAVIDAKVTEWLHDPKMNKYLRPSTLFGAEKFAQYVGQLGTPDATGTAPGVTDANGAGYCNPGDKRYVN